MGNCRKLVTDANCMISCPACNKKFQTFIVDEQESYHNGDISYTYEIDPNEQVVKEGYKYFCVSCHRNLPKLILENLSVHTYQYLERAKVARHNLQLDYRKRVNELDERTAKVKSLNDLLQKTGGDFRTLTFEQLADIQSNFPYFKLVEFISIVRQRQTEKNQPRLVKKPVPICPPYTGYEFDRQRFPYYALVMAYNPTQAREVYEKEVSELKDIFDKPITCNPKELSLEEVREIIKGIKDDSKDALDYFEYIVNSPIAATILIDSDLN